MLFACLSTVRFTTFGIWSHCSGVGFSRTAPPVAVRTPWWMSSIPAVFSSKNMPLYWLLKTRTFSPRCSRYSLSLSFSAASAGATCARHGEDRIATASRTPTAPAKRIRRLLVVLMASLHWPGVAQAQTGVGWLTGKLQRGSWRSPCTSSSAATPGAPLPGWPPPTVMP